MDTNTKYTIIDKVVRMEDDAILNQIKKPLDFNEQDFWKDINPYLKASLERDIEQSIRGEGMPHAEVVNSFKKRKRI